MGACESVGGNIVTDAFGVVAMVAMTPLITIQILGVIYKIKEHRKAVEIPKMPVPASGVIPLDAFGDDDIIEL